MNMPPTRNLALVRSREKQPVLDLIVRTVAFVIVVVPMYFIAAEGIFSDKTDFLLLSAVFMAYTLTEIYVFAKQRPGVWLVGPPVLATLFVFFLGYGLTNFLYLIPGFEYSALRNLVSLQFQWLSYAVVYAMLGTFAMWVGFGFRFGEWLGEGLCRSLVARNVLRTSFQPRWSLVLCLVLLSLFARLIQLQLGFYGTLSKVQHVDPPSYSQYLIMMRQLGLIALLVASMACFSVRQAPLKIRLLTLGLVLHECAWGILAADKAMTVIPIIMVGVCFYALRGRIPKSWVAIAFVALVFGFLVFQPLRQVDFEGGGPAGIGVVTDAAQSIVADQLSAGTDVFGVDLGTTISERLNNTGRTALGIWFSDEGAEGREPPANLFVLLVTSPVAAIIPRALWPGKPSSADVGNWLYQEVAGGSTESATQYGVGPIGFLYLAGGVWVIVIGFLLLGVAQRVMWSAFFQRQAGGLLVFLGLIPSVVIVSSVFYDFIINGFRTFLLLLVIQYVVFKGEPLRSERFRVRSRPRGFKEA